MHEYIKEEEERERDGYIENLSLGFAAKWDKGEGGLRRIVTNPNPNLNSDIFSSFRFSLLWVYFSLVD